MKALAMNTERKIQTEERPLTERARKHEALLLDVAADARSLASTYSKETLVPEGGE